MAGYKPLKIAGNSTGLVQSREDFLLPNDAYPVLENAFVWRERIKRKKGYQLLGRLQRNLEDQAFGNYAAGILVRNIITFLSLETDSSIVPGSFVIDTATTTIADIDPTDPTFPPDGTLYGSSGVPRGTINYATGDVSITAAAAGNQAATITFSYYPGLPVMGLRTRELTGTNNEEMVAFDQVYAYRFVGTAFEEFLPGTTWTGTDSDFFWSTNYWIGDDNRKIFWVTNDVDPIRYTNGVTGTNWVDFTPIINASGDTLDKCLCMLPFRSRLLVFNTTETDGEHPQRIRWAAIGNPFTIASPIVSIVNANAWRDDIRGQGGFLDIPTSEDIITVGFVRDNLVIYCERSTWQLRYTGRSIAPFQIEKVNSELGVESTFSSVQFDTSLVGIGDKGVVECDSYKSDRIDIKIVDLVINDIDNRNNGTKRVHGIRDFQQKLAYWTYPFTSTNGIFPNRRLVYNYENDSWAIFTDSLTALGTFQNLSGRRWSDTPSIDWEEANFSWINRAALFPNIVGGNQQGFVEYLDKLTTNQESLFIQAITGNTTTPTVITSPNHNLEEGDIIKIIDIIGGTFTNLNNQIFSVSIVDSDNFSIYKYDAFTGQYSTGQLDPPGDYIGGGVICVRDNFSITSKKFNYMDEGRQFQLGYIDILMQSTEEGFISLKVYNDYNDGLASNVSPLNDTNDTFFNSVVPTNNLTGIDGGSKQWKRVICPTNSNFITIEWTLNNEQMQNICQESEVQIDAQTIWSRVGGRLGFVN